MHSVTARLKSLFLSSWHPFAWFAVIGFFVYGQTFFFGFSYFDDNVLIVDHIRDLTNFSNIGQIFQTDVFHVLGSSAGYYRPLLTLSFMVNAVFAGLQPFVYHFTNVLIHIAVTCFIFLLLVKLGFRRSKVFCLSLLFLVHPVVVQAVAWIPGRNDSLLALFVVSSFIFFLKYIEKHRRRDYIRHLVLFFFALLTKESAAVLPVVCFSFGLFVKKFGQECLPQVSQIKNSAKSRASQVHQVNYQKDQRLPPNLYVGWLGCLLVWGILRFSAVQSDVDLIGAGIKSVV
ncbi:MAG: glycosyltransferase family 39 protein, partial [Candidatus Omnitrophica bacterium]|nr:glycosyltransferase family 39 protein [Candidatus Omnitrophota bacterium]